MNSHRKSLVSMRYDRLTLAKAPVTSSSDLRSAADIKPFYAPNSFLTHVTDTEFKRL